MIMKKVLLGIFVLFVVVVLVVACEGETSRVESENNGNDEQTLTEVENQDDEDDVNEVVEEDDEYEGVNSDDNSRRSPAGIGERFLVEKDNWLVGKISYEIEMTDVISGEEALNIIMEGNQFNREPEEGKEYVLAEFEVLVIETEDDEPFDLRMGISWSAVSGEGNEYTDFFSVSGINRLEGDLYEGASATGYQPFIIDVDDANAVGSHDRRSSTELWFDLRANQ